MNVLRVLVAGANGFIGTRLCAALREQGHDLTALVRDPPRAARRLPADARVMAWNAAESGPWQDAVREADAVVNLAGASVGAKRWTTEYKQELRDSRIDTTRAIVKALLKTAPRRSGTVLLNASAVGYYGDRGDTIVTEETPPGSDFLARLAVDWEQEARRAESDGVRVVLLRTGIVLGDGGALEQMLKPFRLGVGGPLGSGRQWMPWIHLDDAVGILVKAMQDAAIRGPINVTSPNPVTMREFATTLGRVLHRPAHMPVPALALKLALGEFAGSILGGQRVIPEVARQRGYDWHYPRLELALRDILG